MARTEQDYRELIARGLEGNARYTVDDVMEGLNSGNFHLFEEEKGIVITKFNGYRDKSLLVFLLVGDDFDTWKERITQRLKSFARASQCARIECFARPGLQKSLKGLGWKISQVVLQIDPS